MGHYFLDTQYNGLYTATLWQPSFSLNFTLISKIFRHNFNPSLFSLAFSFQVQYPPPHTQTESVQCLYPLPMHAAPEDDGFSCADLYPEAYLRRDLLPGGPTPLSGE